jgi:hypothetical protein
MTDLAITTAWLAGIVVVVASLMRLTLRVVLLGGIVVAQAFESATDQEARRQDAGRTIRDRNVISLSGWRATHAADLLADRPAAA